MFIVWTVYASVPATLPPSPVIQVPSTSNERGARVSSKQLYCQAKPTYTVYDLITVMSCQTHEIVVCSEYLRLYNNLIFKCSQYY
jgi:hypothetical protein